MDSQVDFRYEMERLIMFEDRGLYTDVVGNNPSLAEILAWTGFYPTDEENVVRCTFCSGSLDVMETNDPQLYHYENYWAVCPFVRGLGTLNVPRSGNNLPYPDPTPPPYLAAIAGPGLEDFIAVESDEEDSHDGPEFSEEETEVLTTRTASMELGVVENTRVFRPYYQDESHRRESFYDRERPWRHHESYPVEEMIKAGFFYLMNEYSGDRIGKVQCFHCNVVIGGWNVRAKSPLEWHKEAVESSGRPCPFVQVACVPSQEEELDVDLTCVVCCEQRRSVVYLPCGHLITCNTCATRFETCAICRVPLKGFVNCYIA